ncbi:MAG: NCS2 family permease [bacterium]|jgi:AGZA family xanthine/uracil permease-like MFS transporter|nr:NCS2 family permease [candidate division KSB1 bacterium]MDH7558760.1 NCS2 family permease [bacterium]
MRRYFKFDELGTNYRTEILAGATTFITMAYIVVVNPLILQGAGIPVGPSTVATILAAFVGTLLMGLYAKRPFAIAPYMGENAFIAVTVVGTLGYTWQQGLAAIFIGGVLFVALTLLKLRSWLASAASESMKYSFVVGIGLFLTFIGLSDMGLVQAGVPGGPPVQLGDVTSTSAILGVIGLVLMAGLMILRVRGSILISVIVVTLLANVLAGVFHVAIPSLKPLQGVPIGLPPDPRPIMAELDFGRVFSWGFLPVLLVVFLMDFLDTMATLIGVSARAGFLDERGNLPEIEKPMLADAVATVVGALLGTTTTGTYIESAAGIEEGGRSGFASVVTAFLFLITLFFCKFVEAVPPFAYGPALVMVGMLMMKPITNIKFDDLTELVPSFAVIVLMSFTYNMGVGMTAGFVLYPIVKLIAGRVREVTAPMWVLGGLSLLFYVFHSFLKP